MKKILVPTDFSECANHASDVAIRLARNLSAEVHFFSRIHIHPNWNELSEPMRQDYPETFARISEAKGGFEALKDKYYVTQVPIVTSYASGDIVSLVEDYIDREDIYMVVMGSNGASGLKNFFFGSNAQKIVRHAHCPVMVIKHPVEGDHIDFKHIIFASDFQEAAKMPYERLLDFGTHFGSHIHLLHIDLTPSDIPIGSEYIERMKAFEEMTWRLPCTIHEIPDLDIESGIQHFAQKINADLVAISPTSRSPMQRLFDTGITEALVNHLEIPVMSLTMEKIGKKVAN